MSTINNEDKLKLHLAGFELSYVSDFRGDETNRYYYISYQDRHSKTTIDFNVNGKYKNLWEVYLSRSTRPPVDVEFRTLDEALKYIGEHNENSK